MGTNTATRASAGLGIIGLAVLPGALLAETPMAKPVAPILRIDSPFAAPLWRLDVDADETALVSSSAYKAVTIWSLSDPGSRRIARVPLRDEQRHRAHGTAISPDGQTVAYSVPPLADASGNIEPGTARIYLLRRSDGVIVHTIDRDVPTRPQALKFSPDGGFLGAVLSSGCGVRVWSAKDWSLAYADDKGYAGSAPTDIGCCPAGATVDCDNLPDTTGIIFQAPVATGRELNLFTAGDTGVRRYERSGETFVSRNHALPKDIALARPEGLALSPDGKSIVVGDRRERDAEGSLKPVELRIAILATDTLKVNREPLTITMDSPALAFPAYLDPLQVPDARLFGLHRVAWVRDGGEEWIFAGGFFACEAARAELRSKPSVTRQDVCIVRWSASRPKDAPHFIPIGTDRVMDLLPLAKSGALLVASSESIDALSYTGERASIAGGKSLTAQDLAADFRDGARTFKISKDGKIVYFEDYRSRQEAPSWLRFDTEKLALDAAPENDPSLVSPNQDPILLSDPDAKDPRSRQWWRNTEGPPQFLRQKLVDDRLGKNDIFRSVAIELDNSIAALGSADFLRIIDIGGEVPKIRCQRPISEEAFRVNITPDGELIVVGHSDGVLRWYRNVRKGEGCSLELVLSVYLSRTASGEWTWIAWVPSGQFANDPRAIHLLSWQVVEAAGDVKTVAFNQLLRWYKRDAVATAIASARATETRAAGPEVATELQSALVTEASKLILEIPYAPETTAKERFRYRVRLGQAGPWPKRMMVKTGDGLRVPVLLDGDAATAHGAGGHLAVNLPAPSNLDREFDLLLPEAARERHGAVDLCFFLDDVQQVCRAIQYTGPLSPPRPRRLWAVIVGFSQHDAPQLTLRYAQNDALDLARLLVKDRERHGGKPDTADFADVHIELVVSPSNKEAEAELKELAKLPYVTVRPPTRDGILAALGEIASRDRDQALMHDLFLFTFSGHGFAHPFNTDTGRTALATPATSPSIEPANFAATTLSSDTLIAALDQISAQKLIMLDACRAPSSGPRYTPFQSGSLTREFAARALTSYIYFSASDGEVSVEQPDFFFEPNRAPAMRGNGLFSYGVLEALVSSQSELGGASSGRRNIDTEEIMRYVEQHVFDLKNPESIAKRLERARSELVQQTPIYVVARPIDRPGAMRHLVLRSLD